MKGQSSACKKTLAAPGLPRQGSAWAGEDICYSALEGIDSYEKIAINERGIMVY